MMAPQTPQTPQSLLSSIRSQSIILPNLSSIFSSYHLEINPELERLRYDVDTFIESSMPQTASRKVHALKAADFAYFSATWWPRAHYSRLRILTFLAVWVFTWDDELDEEDGNLWDAGEEAHLFRASTEEYVRRCLGLEDSGVGFEPSSLIIRKFEIIGTAVRDIYTRDQCARLAGHISDYTDGCRVEERLRHLNILPSVDEYWRYRLRSSAVCVTLAVQEFGFSCPGQSVAPIPPSIMDSPAMEELWMRCNIIISTVNDMLSLKKEISGGNVASMIPLAYAQKGSLQEAVDETTRFLIDNLNAFEQVAKTVVEMGGCGVERQLVRDFVMTARFYMTGNLSWSLKTERYGILRKDLEGGVKVEL